MARAAGQKEWAYVAHPAAGLSYSGRREPRSPLPRKLGMAWLRLSREEQAARRRTFFAALLEPFAERGGATFEARGLADGAAAELALLDDVERERDVVIGPLTRASAVLLVNGAPSGVVLRSGERTLLDARDRWRRVLVLLDDEEARAVDERIRGVRGGSAGSAGGVAAGAGGDRRSRALALLAMHYLLLVLALGVALAVRGMLDGVASPLVGIPVALAAGFVFFSSLEPVLERALRWYDEG